MDNLNIPITNEVMIKSGDLLEFVVPQEIVTQINGTKQQQQSLQQSQPRVQQQNSLENCHFVAVDSTKPSSDSIQFGNSQNCKYMRY